MMRDPGGSGRHGHEVRRIAPAGEQTTTITPNPVTSDRRSIRHFIARGEISVIPAVMPNYARADLAFERGEGAWLWTADGRRFLDFGSGIATTSLGHGHPHLVEAIAEQAAKVMHASNLYRIPQAERLAERLVADTLRRQRVLLQFGRRGERGHDQDDAQIPSPRPASRNASASSASRARSTAARWRRSPPPATSNT